jgi:hypothetical protein
MALILTREHSRVAHGLFMLALIPLNDSVFLIEAAMVVIGCGLGLIPGRSTPSLSPTPQRPAPGLHPACSILRA